MFETSLFLLYFMLTIFYSLASWKFVAPTTKETSSSEQDPYPLCQFLFN